MSEPVEAGEQEVHRKFGVDLFNHVWTLLEKPDRSQAEDDQLYHAQRCLEICQDNDIGDFDLAFAYEALARASVVAGRQADRERYLALAREAGERIKEKEDKEIFFGDLEAV